MNEERAQGKDEAEGAHDPLSSENEFGAAWELRGLASKAARRISSRAASTTPELFDWRASKSDRDAGRA
jgi:hypothetical protein